MKTRLSPGAAAALYAAAIANAPLARAQSCDVLTPERISALSHYVQLKYNLPFNVTAAQSDILPVKDTCFRKIRFTSAAQGRQQFALPLYLSPDQRFLTKDLLDSTQNPILEEQQRKTAVLASLLRTPGPSLGSPDAPVTITVFSDFECPYCKQQAKILREESSPVESHTRIVFRNFPLPFHPWSRQGGRSSRLRDRAKR